jgi:hypothetical protein
MAVFSRAVIVRHRAFFQRTARSVFMPSPDGVAAVCFIVSGKYGIFGINAVLFGCGLPISGL